MYRYFFVATTLVTTATLCRADEAPIRFNRDVRPILTDKCFACHGPDALQVAGGLRLDFRESAVDDAAAIVPGAPEKSEVMRRILTADQEQVMPPPESHKALSPTERETLARWIAQGAPYEAHWAYTAMRMPSRFDETSAQSLSKRIDAMIEGRLTETGLKPLPLTDRVTLIRRLSFDLTGLPPTPAEVDQFVHDASQDAYAKLVQRLLESPRFGERMAIYWLDLVRYADTVGYHGDQDISQWPYRDYVINAFNRNLPYDQFIREQLAGDLLPAASVSQLVASGYNRLNQTTEEGGSQAKEYLAIYFADRVRNVSQVFMGATMGCAQCHDHKYDPYTTRDFYSLGAFFADLDEVGVYRARSRPPMMQVVDPETQQALDRLDRHLAELESQALSMRKRLRAEQQAWEADSAKQLGLSAEVESVWIDDEPSLGGKKDPAWRFVTAAQGPVLSGEQSRRQQGDGVVQHLFQNLETPWPVTPSSRYFAWVYLSPQNPPTAIMLQFNDGNWEHRKVWGSDDLDFGRKPESHAAYRRAGKLPTTGRWVRLEVAADEVGLADGAQVNGMAFTQFGGLAYWDRAGEIRSDGIPPHLAAIMEIPRSSRTHDQAQRLTEHFLNTHPEFVKLQETIDRTRVERTRLYEATPQTVVSKSVAPRTIRILPRGNWMDDSGEEVTPAIPQFLGSLETGRQRPTRLDLANWLCQPENPLTSRTMVNRLWSLMFGRGICASVDDLGGQGTYPSDPELLDLLAIQFVRSGWDIKYMLRSIAMSQTYRRSSTPTSQWMIRDPENELFARQGRFTIDAEMVRDAGLAISGLLVEEVGGRSVRPYQPAGYYAQLNFPRREYSPDTGQSQYRRGVYTHWQRTFLHPMLKAFDAPSREECTAQRAKSNTPLQALALLNDPTFVEAARVFAAQIMKSEGETTPSKIDWAYRAVVSRQPSEAVRRAIEQVYQEHLEYYRRETESAKQLISVGDAPVETEMSAAELAAWTSVARVLLNLHEAISRY